MGSWPIVFTTSSPKQDFEEGDAAIHKGIRDGSQLRSRIAGHANELPHERRYNKAIFEFEKARTASSDNADVLSHLARAYVHAERRAEALKILHRLERPSQTTSWDLALIYIALSDKSKAIDLLEKATVEHVGWVILLGIEPAFDSLRNEPQFEKLKQRVGVPAQTR